MNTLTSCSGPIRISRREMIQVGAASLLGLSLPQFLRASSESRQKSARADHCIIIFLNGGPSHLDMWDMKPEAPAEIRGEFKPISTNVTGIHLSDQLPRLARHMDKVTLVRSVHHRVNNAHAAAVYTGLTGHDRGDATTLVAAGRDDYPAVGSIMTHLRPPTVPIVPFVSMPFITQEGAGGPPQPGFFGGWMGRNYDPLFVLRRDPNAPNFRMPELTLAEDVDSRRFNDRRRLINELSNNSSSMNHEMNSFQAKAFDLLASPATEKAFQIAQEPLKVRDSYGRNIYGQSVLLARRLIEAGTRVACVSWAPDANATWDTHGQNFKKLKTELLPQLDAAVSSLLEDMQARGLLERTVVAVMGEFGRTPKVNGNAGRDHWNFCYSLMLAGGGFKGGHVYGASDKIGGRPSRNPVTPADVIATIYEVLGIPSDTELKDRLARPFTLVPWGNPIADLVV